MFFLNPNKPLSTCLSANCDNCSIDNNLCCHFNVKQLILFYLIVLPVYIIGGVGIYNQSTLFLLIWIIGGFLFVIIFQIRVMCSHCPHYAEPDTFLKCWALYGTPKLWKFRPGPMTVLEKFIFIGGHLIIRFYAIYFMVTGKQWFLLILFLIVMTLSIIALRYFLCPRCMNFACPLNGVDDNIRKKFFSLNPDVAKAWNVNTSNPNNRGEQTGGSSDTCA